MEIVRSKQMEYVPASHEDPSRPGVLKRVLATKPDFIDGRVQMLNWSRLPIGSSFQAHYHEDMQEAFLIINGYAHMQVGDESTDVFEGDLVLVPPRVVHKMTNRGECDVEYIVFGISTGQGGKTVVVEE